jgi:hypothetical protein
MHHLIVPIALIAQEAEEESKSINLSKRDNQEKKQRKKRERAYIAQSTKENNRPSPRRKPPANIIHHIYI